MSTLAGRSALVVGAAQGIGAVIAQELASAGAQVVVADIQVEKGTEVAERIRAEGGQAHFLSVDLTSDEELERLVDGSVEACGGLDTVVYSAAPSRQKRLPFPENLQTWDREQSLLLQAPARLAGFALPHLERSPNGSVISITSVLGFSVSQESAAYHASKAGLIQLTRYLAYHLGSRGVRANAVCPGVVDREPPAPRLSDDPTNAAVLKKSVPLGRAGRSRDIAQAVVYLASDAASYVTGQSLVVDGGLSLGEPFGVGRRGFLAGRDTPSG